MITSETSGVWSLDDAYHKDNAGYWNYTEAPVGPGTLYAWGRIAASGGQLAQNDDIQRSSPIQIPGTGWNGQIDGQYTFFAIKPT